MSSGSRRAWTDARGLLLFLYSLFVKENANVIGCHLTLSLSLVRTRQYIQQYETGTENGMQSIILR